MADTEQPFLVIVDIYGNGYDQDPTQRNVVSLPVDPTNLPAVGAHVAVSLVSGQGTTNAVPYCINSGGGAGLLLAKISNIAGAPTMYQVDSYGGGFTSAPTQTAVTAFPVDLAAASFGIGDQVATFVAGGRTWIDTSHPWTTQQVGTVIVGKITNVGSAPSYDFVEMTAPGGTGVIKSGGISGTCQDWSGLGNGLSLNMIVRIEKWADGNWYIDYPIGSFGSA